MAALVAVMAAVVSCSNRAHTEPVEAVATDATELTMPVIPASITDTHQRALYLLTHFWDNMDFTDTVRSHSSDFMEQTFANYLSLWPLVDEDETESPVQQLMADARADDGAYAKLREVASKYLYDPNSPMANEEYYATFLHAMLADETLDATERERYEFEQECIAKNHRGTVAADFTYVDRTGCIRHFSSTPCTGRHLMLMFVDTHCNVCRQTLADLTESAALNEMLADGQLTVLAICAEGTRDEWREVESELPATWLTGYDVSGIADDDIYVLRAMPAIYVLSPSHIVELKDATAPQALSFAAL